MDTSILIPIAAALALLMFGFVWRREPAGTKADVAAKDTAGKKTTPPKAGKASLPSTEKTTARPQKPAVRPAQTGAGASRTKPKRPAAETPEIPRFEEEADLDITVIKAVVLEDLLAPPSDPKTATDEEESEQKGKPTRVEVSFEDEAESEEVTAPVARILISAAGDSDRGQKRQKNEDSLLVLPERSLFAVADGMGGYRGGEVASTLAIDTIREAFESGAFEGKVESAMPMPRRGRELACAMQMANQAIRGMAEVDPELSQMGTTLVAARFSPNKQRVYIGHVGDSRCYRLRGTVLRQLTTDHTLSSLGVKGAHAKELFQAIGVKASITIDLIVDKPRDNDVYLLCSDGLSKMVTDEEVREVLIAEPDLEAAVYALIEKANDRGGRDNITLILVKVLSRMPRELSSIS